MISIYIYIDIFEPENLQNVHIYGASGQEKTYNNIFLLSRRAFKQAKQKRKESFPKAPIVLFQYYKETGKKHGGGRTD